LVPLPESVLMFTVSLTLEGVASADAHPDTTRLALVARDMAVMVALIEAAEVISDSCSVVVADCVHVPPVLKLTDDG
jgi:hypothetical protein